MEVDYERCRIGAKLQRKMNNRQSWEMYKRQRIMTYPKRRNRTTIIIVIVALIFMALLFCRKGRNCATASSNIKMEMSW